VALIAAQETTALSRFRALLGEDLAEIVRSVGSTPTLSVVERFDDCDEVRPGNYVFYDAFQATLGSCRPADVAVSVLTTVVGCYPDRGSLIIDAGALAMSKDAGANHIDPEAGFGHVTDLALVPQPLRLIALSQEHGKIAGDPAEIARHPVGTELRIVPNHSCLTAAMFDTYYVLEGDRLVDEWHPVAGW
jgi:D-serine deaminase-like pyridoxal phosphate-dependent protein